MSNEGKQVKVHYRGTLDDGTEFDSSYSRNEPLAFTCMGGQMIKGFDAAVRDMEVGETKKVHIPCEEAYGPHNPELVQKVPANQIPNVEWLPLNQTLLMQGANGQPIPVRITERTDTMVTLDMNSEMAGKDLNFEITLLEVAD